MLDCVVALTSWKGRIYNSNFMLVIYKLLTQQTDYNYKVVLSLSEEEFPHKCDDLPPEFLTLQRHPRFEILWSYANTRSLKNYFPVKRLYNTVPIIVVGDDTLYSGNLVQTMMNEHTKTPIMALGNDLWYWPLEHDRIPILCRVRLFPPKCMFNLCEDYFVQDFKNLENDVFYGICLQLNNTKCRKVSENMVDCAGFYGQQVSLSHEYTRQINNPIELYHRFMTLHPELHEIILKNLG